MKLLQSIGAVALLLAVAITDASAQRKLSGFAAIGSTTTTGDLKDADSTKSGFMVQGGLEYQLSAPLWLRFEASMGWNDRQTNLAEDAYIVTFAGRAEYWLPPVISKLRPYVLGGAGFMQYKRNPGNTGLEFPTKNRIMVGGGAGLDWQVGGSSIFVEGRYDMGLKKDDETGSARGFIPVIIGARWGAR